MRPTLTAAILLVLLTSGACAPGGEAPPVEADTAADDAPAELVPTAPEEPAAASLPADRAREDPLPEEIYYSLDDFEWYRQAQPIVHGGRAFEARDTVLVRSTLELDSLARFGGVLYWARSGDSEPDTVFVPVFEGYWLPFVAGDGGA